MPTYDFRCPEGHVFERFQPMSAPPPTGCEICGAGPVERVLHAPAVHFKGSGFYSTDYGRGGKKKDGKEGEGVQKDGAKKDGAKKDGEKSSDKASPGKDSKPSSPSPPSSSSD
jgi:putative FmdB family regulatory protein